jgi:hypothetical protein
MTADRSEDLSDIELRDAVLRGWHRLETSVESSSDELGAVENLTGVSFRRLDMVRHVRNEVAHSDGSVGRARLSAALRAIADAERQLKDREEASSGLGRRASFGKPAPRQTWPIDQRGPARQPAGKRGQPPDLEFHAAAGEEASQLIRLSRLGLGGRDVRVTCDVPWLHGETTGRSVKLTAKLLAPNSKQRGSVRIDSSRGSVTIIVDMYTSPSRSRTSPVVSFSRAKPVDLPNQPDAMTAVAVVLFVVAAIVLLVALGI